MAGELPYALASASRRSGRVRDIAGSKRALGRNGVRRRAPRWLPAATLEGPSIGRARPLHLRTAPWHSKTLSSSGLIRSFDISLVNRLATRPLAIAEGTISPVAAIA